MIKKEIVIPILSIVAIIGVFTAGYVIEGQELASDKNSITISNIQTSFEKDPWVGYYMGNVTALLESNKSFEAVTGLIEYYDSNGVLITSNYMMQPIKIVEGQKYKINEQYYGGNDNIKPASIKIIIYDNTNYNNAYQSNESIIFEKKLNI
ncbi:hypothetical protein MARBORIA2_14540 [Methanobrevibacter arboriphilus]|uniref:hypothetical protein n=1 Tax=Methanobrevibacter arboriphilus TaxID=39441 RepID=UPI0022ED6392|nr:hypothetical protein [Methanobrevibacter arboriphilus]GLI12364.1 hypothetical protein MARBORIA2_14540 [Methanobrevibacter arboriphilus]